MKNDVGDEHNQQYKRAIFQHPDFSLKLEQQSDVLAIAIHVQTEEENEQKNHAKDGVKNEPVLFHQDSDNLTNIGFYPYGKNGFLT